MSVEKLLTFDEVVERYKIKKWGLRHLIRQRTIPIVRIGTGRGRIYFDPTDLDNWINENKIKIVK